MPTQAVPSHPAFKLLREQRVASLNIDVQEFEHIATGAQHIHLASSNPENVFLVALRTVPEDSTGVAHILEHTALCGSERYPVRDPFFMMTRRSLNTFMNAFTSSDWTAYPFASVNRKDFNNLLDVYLDAVFFSRLDKLDFAQEGHRLEFSQFDDKNSDLEFKGVVFNEMKGAMSSVNSQLWQTLTKHLFPTSTYHFNSGGEPSCIPDLSYEQLVEFYKTHYHPSNATFMTYGDISAAEHQAKFENQALKHFEKLDKTIAVTDEKRLFAPMRVQEHYPLSEESLERKTHVVTGWLLGQSTDLQGALKAHLMSSVLLDNSASPLMQALETSKLGQSPSPLCGLDDSQKEVLFACGIAGSEPENALAIEALILDTLKKVQAEGIAQEDIEAALHQLELQQREVGGDSYPYGLQLILNGLTAATHRGDTVAQLNVDAALANLREDIKDPQFISQLIDEWLINNPHRVTLTLSPDGEMGARMTLAEKAKLAGIQSQLTEAQKDDIVEQAKALKARQAKVDDDSVLPKVTLQDVSPTETMQDPNIVDSIGTHARALFGYDAGTNGLVYQQIICDLPSLDESLYPLLPLYCALLTETGIGEQSYLDVQRWQARVCGSISAYSSIRPGPDAADKLNSFLVLSGKALDRNQQNLTELMNATLYGARFNEGSRIRELIAQMRTHREQSITGSGHALAMQCAAKGIAPAAQLSFEMSGLAAIKRLKALDDSIKSDEALKQLQQQLNTIHVQIQNAPKRLLVISEPAKLGGYLAEVKSIANQAAPSDTFTQFNPNFTPASTQQAWLTSTQVNFCAKAYATVPSDHPDSAALVVLGNLLRNGFLHTHIREQGGAYGGGASQDNSNGIFRFYSYRDPRLGDTLADFDRAIDWATSTDHSWQSVEEAILGVVSSLDKPDSPAGGAKRDFHAMINGRSLETRQRFRERLLSVDAAALKAVANLYLKPETAHTCVISGNENASKIEKLGLKTEKL